MPVFKNKFVVDKRGVCPICENEVTFRSEYDWLRDHFLCSCCGSIPRERALIHVIKMYYPNYRELSMHESSPGNRGASPKLKAECSNYSASFFYPDINVGEDHPSSGYQCQDLENLTFGDNSFDLFVTQDVMEHVFNPAKVFKEIARVLKPEGAHIFTVPLINKEKRSECWALRDNNGEIIYRQTPEYHGNPIDSNGSLVTMHWGYDIAEFIQRKADTPTTIIYIDNMGMGIRAEFIEVLLSRKYSEIS